MKRKEFERELRERLEENRRLVEHPYLPAGAFGVAAFVGRHLFWVNFWLAGVLAAITMIIFSEQLQVVHVVMLFL